MIYDPRRRAMELRQRIIGTMTNEELEEYACLLEEPESPKVKTSDSPRKSSGGVKPQVDRPDTETE